MVVFGCFSSFSQCLQGFAKSEIVHTLIGDLLQCFRYYLLWLCMLMHLGKYYFNRPYINSDIIKIMLFCVGTYGMIFRNKKMIKGQYNS